MATSSSECDPDGNQRRSGDRDVISEHADVVDLVQSDTWIRRSRSHQTVSPEAADIARVLFSADDIYRRVCELAREISADLAGKQVVVLGVATGAFVFLADLVRELSLPVQIGIIHAQSYYGSSTESAGRVNVSFDRLKVDISAKHVLLVEDIIDTGRTLQKLLTEMVAASPTLFPKPPASISVCALLDKQARRVKPLPRLIGSGKLYAGYDCEDVFVVGYGLDFDERYRSLPFIGVLKSDVFLHSAEGKQQRRATGEGGGGGGGGGGERFGGVLKSDVFLHSACHSQEHEEEEKEKEKEEEEEEEMIWRM
ncbi:hypothetical protein CBR_g38956 [Chara braunii]|uniref:Phosphoribosyltransferase domain-containing protein n=1 Tax=Chara braunii TaxID=69332 RepID=A0A388K0U8_CHABU|nr:hypothetical protein CBR_g38956 [Chara braunii]|eukprot:GBG63645.1 hypothetical protein CBR_g38956 [Chara braunii]